MTEAEIAALESWAADVGLKGSTEIALVEGFCDRALAAGLPLARAAVFIDTLHPIYEGRTFRWERENHQATLTEYGRSTEGELAERWRASPWFRLLRDGELMLRRRITAETESEFASFPELRAASITDYVATVHPFAADGVIGSPARRAPTVDEPAPQGTLDRLGRVRLRLCRPLLLQSHVPPTLQHHADRCKVRRREVKSARRGPTAVRGSQFPSGWGPCSSCAQRPISRGFGATRSPNDPRALLEPILAAIEGGETARDVRNARAAGGDRVRGRFRCARTAGFPQLRRPPSGSNDPFTSTPAVCGQRAKPSCRPELRTMRSWRPEIVAIQICVGSSAA